MNSADSPLTAGAGTAAATEAASVTEAGSATDTGPETEAGPVAAEDGPATEAGPPSDSSATAGSPHGRAGRRPLWQDLAAVAVAVALFTVTAFWGRFLEARDGSLHVGWPPLYSNWLPHLGPGTPAALVVAVAVIAYGPAVAQRLSWGALLGASWATGVAWVFSLALIDGWQRGIAVRLTTRYEYLQVIDRFDDIGATLRGFTQHILIDSQDHWPPHVAGHPPLATLTFVWLDRIGLGGGAWAAVFVVLAGASAAVAVLVTLRALAGERWARTAAPFLVLAPTAVWAGVSADGWFAAVAAWAVALLALAATTRGGRGARAAVYSAGAGLVLGATFFLSYGLTIFAGFVVAVLLLTRTVRPLPLLLLGACVVPTVFAVAGFNWWEAYHLLVERYYQGAASVRPYHYWLLGNLACAALIAGPATVAGLRRVLAGTPGTVRAVFGRAGAPDGRAMLTAVVVTGALAVLAADLSGMSKAETERIWLPFVLWLLPAAALLPRSHHRAWLAAQACLALLINHLLLTAW